MPNRQYITNPCQLLAEDQIIINTTNDAKFQHRVELVCLVLGGLSTSFLSQYCARSKNTITSRAKTVVEKGGNTFSLRAGTGINFTLSATYAIIIAASNNASIIKAVKIWR